MAYPPYECKTDSAKDDFKESSLIVIGKVTAIEKYRTPEPGFKRRFLLGDNQCRSRITGRRETGTGNPFSAFSAANSACATSMVARTALQVCGKLAQAGKLELFSGVGVAIAFRGVGQMVSVFLRIVL